jgi:hypothetical protein
MKVHISLVVALAIASCSTRSERTSSTELTSAPYAAYVTNHEAALQLMTARCDHEIACKNVGSQRQFINRDGCAKELGGDVRAELRDEECAGGVDRSRLATCLALVRRERCGSYLDSLDRESTCRRDALCPR